MSDIVENEHAVACRPVTRLRCGQRTELQDELVVEEPLEIRIGTRSFTSTMRTPQGEASDLDLARGLLFSEGVIRSVDDIASLKVCDIHEAARGEGPRVEGDAGVGTANVISAQLSQSQPQLLNWHRNLIANSSCGLCGKTSIDTVSSWIATRFESLESTSAWTPASRAVISAETLVTLPDIMRQSQLLFEKTGGLHAAALFRTDGTLVVCREDIGRHNAVDKVLGWGLRERLIPAGEPLVLLCSGRASFEILQKALMARIVTVASVSAASNLAVDLARKHGATLVGFLRPHGFTIYCGNERIAQE